MNPLAIEIYDEKVVRYLAELCKKTNQTPVQVVTDIVRTLMNAESEHHAEGVERLVYELNEEYYKQYECRFGLRPTDENGDGLRCIFEVVYTMVAELKNVAKVAEKLQKAIVWYINFHDNTDSNGQNFPYGLKYLFSKKNPWLLRSCIESSVKLDDKMFKLMQNGKLTREEAIRTIKRGDAVGSGKQKSKVALLDEALAIYTELRKKYGKKLPPNFKFHPTIDLLFKSETPSEEYILEAIKALSNFKKAIELKINNEQPSI